MRRLVVWMSYPGAAIIIWRLLTFYFPVFGHPSAMDAIDPDHPGHTIEVGHSRAQFVLEVVLLLAFAITIFNSLRRKPDK